MTVAASGLVDRVRGVTTGLLIAALAVAAHGAGGVPHPGTPRCLLTLIAVSQVLGHLLLSAAGQLRPLTPTKKATNQ
jgi:hypothetical protein